MKRLAVVILAAILFPSSLNAQWVRVDTNLPGDSQATLVAADEEYMYALLRLAGNGSAMYRSSDGGANWADVSEWPDPQFSPSVFVETEGYLVAAGELGSAVPFFAVSGDQGATWTVTEPADVALPTTITSDGTLLYAGSDAEMAVSSDGGASWSVLNGSPIGVSAIAVSGQEILVIAEGAFLYRSTDGGSTWTEDREPILAGTTTQLTGVWNVGSTFYIKPNIGSIHASVDGGVTWTEQPTYNPFVWFTAEVFPGASAWLLYVGASIPFLSWDQGATAVELSDGFPTNIVGAACTNTPLITNTYVLVNAWGCFNDNTGVYRYDLGPPPVNVQATDLPQSFSLSTAYPNPFQDNTRLIVDVEASGNVTVSVHDILGQSIKTLEEGYLTAGSHEFIVDGSGLAAGTYFIRVKVNGNVQTRMVSLVK